MNAPLNLHTKKEGTGKANRFCLECGGGKTIAVHNPDHVRFEHEFKQPKSAARLCPFCAAGDHDSGRKSDGFGCINLVAQPPKDFVCGCAHCKVTTPQRVMTTRTSAEGMTACRF